MPRRFGRNYFKMKKLTIIIMIGILLIGLVIAVGVTNISKDIDKSIKDFIKLKSNSTGNPVVEITGLGCDEEYCYFYANLTNIIDSTMKLNRYYGVPDKKDEDIIIKTEYTDEELRIMMTDKVWARIESHVQDELNPTSRDEKDIDVNLEFR